MFVNYLRYCALFCVLATYYSHSQQHTFFSKVIIWGHPLHSHTHSYVHNAFYRAFKHLGYETYWVSTQEELQGIDLHNALFFTEGQVDSNMPHRLDCYYIVHNWNPDNYQDLFPANRCILLQVYTHDCLQYSFEKIDECMYCDINQKLIFLPWATDLLPYEIDAIKKTLPKEQERTIYWIGTLGGGRFGNKEEVEGFQKACVENDIAFKQTVNVSVDQNITLIQNSYMAPALQGPFQCEKGYIPCRIFKNISYGQWGITNNKAVYDLFEQKIIFNEDTHQLFYDAQNYLQTAQIEELYELMDMVKNRHTYINRIETLLAFMKRALAPEE